MMPKRLILARHGESTFDAQQRFSGRSDPPLTDQGVEQAHALATSLALRGIDAFGYVRTSPLQAAAQTARIVVDRIGSHRTIEDATELDERDYGDLTGMTYGEALATKGRPAVERMAHACFALAEDPLAETMRRFMDAIVSLNSDASILVVSYDDNLRILEALIDGAPRQREPWRTGMALDYAFDDTGKVRSKDAMQAAPWVDSDSQ